MNTLNTLTPEKIAEIKAKTINYSDIPKLEKEDFEHGHFKNWKPVKKAVSIRIDNDNLTLLKQKGKGYQQRLNSVLRWAKEHGYPLA